MSTVAGKLAWTAFAIGGAACLAVVALQRGESINALWLVAAALAIARAAPAQP